MPFRIYSLIHRQSFGFSEVYVEQVPFVKNIGKSLLHVAVLLLYLAIIVQCHSVSCAFEKVTYQSRL